MSQIKWKLPVDKDGNPVPAPKHVLQMFVIDRQDRLLLMHRSNNVRSARNVWSIPSGEHELGETVADCLTRELKEEYGLEAQMLQLLDQYENIAGDKDAEEQYHWVISLYLTLVDDVTAAINREPDKHDQMIFVKYHDLANDDFLLTYPFHPSLHNRLVTSRLIYVDHMHELLHPLGKEYINPLG